MRIVFCLLLTAALHLSGAEPEPASWMDWNNQGSALYQKGAYAEAEHCFLQAKALPDAAQSPAVAINLGAVYRAEARYTQAEPFYREALAISRRQGNIPEALRALNGLALLYLAEQNYPAAGDAARQSLALANGTNQNSAEALKAANNLARVQLAEGRYADARVSSERVLAATSAGASYLVMERVNAYQTLGRIHLKQLDYAAAAKNFEAAVALLPAANPIADPATVASLWNDLGRVKSETGDFNAAQDYLHRSLNALEQLYGRNHPDVAATLRNLGVLSCNRKHYRQAQAQYRRALAIDEKTFGSRSAGVAADLNGLGSVAFHGGHLAQAQTLFSQALDLESSLDGPDNPEVGTMAGNLAVVLLYQRHAPEAEPLLRKALAIRQAHYGAEDPVLANLRAEYTTAVHATRIEVRAD